MSLSMDLLPLFMQQWGNPDAPLNAESAVTMSVMTGADIPGLIPVNTHTFLYDGWVEMSLEEGCVVRLDEKTIIEKTPFSMVDVKKLSEESVVGDTLIFGEYIAEYEGNLLESVCYQTYRTREDVQQHVLMLHNLPGYKNACAFISSINAARMLDINKKINGFLDSREARMFRNRNSRIIDAAKLLLHDAEERIKKYRENATKAIDPHTWDSEIERNEKEIEIHKEIIKKNDKFNAMRNAVIDEIPREWGNFVETALYWIPIYIEDTYVLNANTINEQTGTVIVLRVLELLFQKTDIIKY
jgi:hypothetical protein